MSKSVALAAVVAAATLAGFAPANAADLPFEREIIIEEPVIEYHPAAYYARVDCAYAFSQTPDMIVGSMREHYVQKNGGRIEIEDNWACGVGIGHRFHENLRIDATVEWRAGFEVEGIPALAGGLGQRAKVDSTVGLVNLYYDFGKWGGFTPYVGAGVGVAQNKISNVLVPSSGFFTYGNEETSLAWALMAGASYDLTDELAIDAGYRYINFGDVSSSSWGQGGAAVPPIEVNDMAAHEIRVGLRYSFY